MKHTLYLIFFLILNLTIYSQNIDWVKNMEGVRNCEGYSIALDASGNVYTTGYFDSIMDFDPGPGTYTLASQGRRDIFISKLDPSGHFVWAKSMGTWGDDVGFAVKIDGSNNVVVTGSFVGSVDFDPGIGTHLINSTAQDMFVLKLDNNGNFIWARNSGGTDLVEGRSLSLDPLGNIYLTGRFRGTVDFDPGVNTYNLSNINTSGHAVFFISKLDASGNFLWAHSYGISGWYDAMSITNDLAGNVYTTGSYSGSADFDVGPGTQILTSPSHSNTYFLKLDASGNFLWVKEFADSTSHSYGNAIALDNAGNIYSTGSFTGTKDFDPGVGTFTMTASSSQESYLMKLDNSGNFLWARQMSGNSKGLGINLDYYGNIISTGIFNGTADIDSGPGVYNLSVPLGTWEMYFMKTHPVTGSVLAAKIFGAGSWCQGTSIVTDGLNNIFATGFFEGTGAMVDFDPGPSTFTLNTTDRNNNFIIKLNDNTITEVNELISNVNILSVYPNPNNGTFNIVSKEKMNLSLINNLGQIVETIELNETNGYQQNIYVKASGIYFINGATDKPAIKQKIIVTK